MKAKLAEEKERLQAVERGLHEKLQTVVKEKEVLDSKIAELEAQLVDSESRFSRKSDLAQSLQDELGVFERFGISRAQERRALLGHARLRKLLSEILGSLKSNGSRPKIIAVHRLV